MRSISKGATTEIRDGTISEGGGRHGGAGRRPRREKPALCTADLREVKEHSL